MTGDEFLAWWRALPLAPSERILGTELIACDRAARSVELAFDVPSDFANARGTVQGGFVAAMLDTCMGIPVLLASDGAKGPVSLSMTTNFLGAAPTGRILGTGRVAKLGGSVAFCEAILHAPDGTELATATQAAKLFDRPAT